MFRQASPYAELDEKHYQALLHMLAEGYNGRQGIRSAYLHRDAVSRTLRGRRGSKLTAVTSGGTIPDNADYSVLLEPQGLNIGSVNEDFAVESIAGDVFQLGNTSYRILRVETGKVRVEDAQGQPPTIPFWLGEAPGRSAELSFAVARLQAQLDELLGATPGNLQPAPRLADRHPRPEPRQRRTTGGIPRPRAPDPRRPAVARHAADGAVFRRVRRHATDHPHARSAAASTAPGAWPCASASAAPSTSNCRPPPARTPSCCRCPPATALSSMTSGATCTATAPSTSLIQAVLDAPLFGVRWRWNAGVALALPRYTGGRKVAPQIQRMKSEDLIASVFPDQIACVENLAGEREIPDHPLVEQTLDDCLHDAMDSEGWLALLRRMERGEVRLISRDLPAPSPLAAEILSARPYTFLDDAPLEERRTQAVLNRRWTDPQSTDDLGALDAEAIQAVREEAWPTPDRCR